MFQPGGRGRITLLIVAAEAVLAAALVVAAGWADRGSRSAGPEAPLAAYAAALAREDLAGTLDQLAPELRPRAVPFIEWQLGNRYAILESAVRGASLLNRLTGSGDRQTTVVASIEVYSEGYAPWRTVEELPVGLIDGRWLLLKVPLEPPG